MSSNFAVEIFTEARADKALPELAATWIENDRILSSTYPGSECVHNAESDDTTIAECTENGV